MKTIIHTTEAPKAIGPYSQAIKVNNTVYISGQIPLIPESMTLDNATFKDQVQRVFNNLTAVVNAAGGQLSDIVKLNIYMTELREFDVVNTLMAEYFSEPYPARAAVQVAGLPKDVDFEVDAVMVLP